MPDPAASLTKRVRLAARPAPGAFPALKADTTSEKAPARPDAHRRLIPPAEQNVTLQPSSRADLDDRLGWRRPVMPM